MSALASSSSVSEASSLGATEVARLLALRGAVGGAGEVTPAEIFGAGLAGAAVQSVVALVGHVLGLRVMGRLHWGNDRSPIGPEEPGPRFAGW